jgi:hypothetical protein
LRQDSSRLISGSALGSGNRFAPVATLGTRLQVCVDDVLEPKIDGQDGLDKLGSVETYGASDKMDKKQKSSSGTKIVGQNGQKLIGPKGREVNRRERD